MSIFPDEFDPTYEDYVSKFIEYDEEAEGMLWARGDLLVEFTYQPSMAMCAESVHGRVKGLRALASDVAKHHKTLERWRYTAQIFQPENRIPDLSFSHHTAAAYSQKPLYWLQKAADNEWSKTQLLNAIKAAEHPEEAWVSKRIHSNAELQILGKGDINLDAQDFAIALSVKEDDPMKLGLKLGKTAQVEVEARIRVRKSGGDKT